MKLPEEKDDNLLEENFKDNFEVKLPEENFEIKVTEEKWRSEAQGDQIPRARLG